MKLVEESVERTVTFDEDDVREWCERHDDSNPLHLDEEAAADGPFGRRVVPGIMLLDKLSGMLTEMGGEDDDVILAGVTASRFRDPVLLGEEVTLSVEVAEDKNTMTIVDFDARVEERGSLVAHGTLSIVIR